MRARKRSTRGDRSQAVSVPANGRPETDDHDLDDSAIDELDEISGDEQLALIWCDTHQTDEWHWISRVDLPMRYRPRAWRQRQRR